MRSVGVDVGGTTIKGVLMDGGDVVDQAQFATPASDPSAMVDTIVDTVVALRATDVTPVGVAVAAFVDKTRRRVMFSPNITWSDFPLADILENRLGQPVTIENDANAACFGEFSRGAGRDSRSLVMVTLGTGVGGAVMVDGRLVTGETGIAGELGHLPLADSSRQCGCGGWGCIETVASGTAIVARVQELYADGELATEKVAEVLEQSPTIRDRVVGEVGEVLAKTILTLVQVVDPDRVVMGGGVMDRSGPLVLEAIDRARGNLLRSRHFATWPRVVPATLGNRAGAVGAAMLAHHHSAISQ